MIGRSSAFLAFHALLHKIAAYDAPVLIEGETGTGKELAAREIHYNSKRRNRPFVPVNCGALPDTLVENELFGHCRGAYTDAGAEQSGLVDLAQGGTLLLDEVDSLSRKAQVTLLRFLQDKEYRPLGARATRKADVRVIAASNRELEGLVQAGEFRLDLFYRLRILCVHAPPLRERHGDARLLAEQFVLEAAASFDKPALPFDADALAWLDEYAWPGNVRELENTVQRAFLLADGPSIALSARTGSGNDSGEALDYHSAKSQAIHQFERRFLSDVMQRTGGNITAAARLIGTERRHLGRLLKRLGKSASQPPSAEK